MNNVLINGFNGKMGQELYKALKDQNDFNVVAGVDINTDSNIIPVYSNTEDIKEDINIIIDFSTPEATLNILKYASSKNIPIVIATTGFNEEQLKIIENYSKELPIFISSNMSFEINMMLDIASKLAKQLDNADIEIIETHHRNKIDSPSGTALMLANEINQALDNKMEYTYDRHSKREKRSDKEIGIHSIRGGTEVGKHTIMFYSDNESFELSHTVTSRSIFANGSIKAAKFLLTQQNGLYNMKNLIK